MGTIIPILRDTVRPNPDRGLPTIPAPGRKTCWFRLHDAPIDWVGKGLKLQIPAKGFVDGVTFTSEMFEVDRDEGTVNAYCVALNSQIPETLTGEGLPEGVRNFIEWGFDADVTENINTDFGREFLYDHDMTVPVACTECGESTSVGKIPEVDFTDSDGDWRCADQCPHCGALHSFDYEFEKL